MPANFDAPEVFLIPTWFTVPFKSIQLPSEGSAIPRNINRSDIHILIPQNMLLSNIRYRKSNLQPGSIYWLSTFYVIFVLSIEISRIAVFYFCVSKIKFVSWEQSETQYIAFKDDINLHICSIGSKNTTKKFTAIFIELWH